MLSGGRDLNPRPPDPQSGALPNCATARALVREPRLAVHAEAALPSRDAPRECGDLYEGAQMCFGSHSMNQ